jgi:hypothetical protein
MVETEYDRAWRERGEAEAALRKWRQNQQSPTFIKGTAVFGGLVATAIVVGFISDPGWDYSPSLVLALIFATIPLLAPAMLRDQRKARAEAEATLKRLKVWEKIQ